LVECPEYREKIRNEQHSNCGEKLNNSVEEFSEELSESHGGLIILGYILAVLGAFTLFIGIFRGVII